MDFYELNLYYYLYEYSFERKIAVSDIINKIFISHAHKDKEYVEQLVNIIKVTRIEEKGVNIICTSVPGHGIPGDPNIYDYLSEKLNENVWVIYLLSENYYNSAACLNEMGATWILKKKYSTFVTPNFNFKDIRGAIDVARNAFKLDEKVRINDFKQLLLQEFQTTVTDNIWESVRDSSLEKIVAVAKQEKIEMEKKNSLSVKLETVRKLPDGNMKVTIRCINNSKHSLELSYFKLTLTDDHGHIFSEDVEPASITLNSEENKLFFLDFPIGDSSYSAARHESGKIEDTRFINIHVGGSN